MRATVTALLVGLVVGALGVGLVMGQINSPTQGPASVASYEPTTDNQLITVAVLVGRLDSIGSAGTQEDTDSVRINVSLLHWRGTAPADLFRVYVPIRLERALGSRRVLDAEGKPLPQRAR